MNFYADKTGLVEAVNNASKASAVKSTMPALEGVLLNLKDNKLTVTGYDLEMGIKSMIEVDGREDGEIVLNAKIFAEMIKRMPTGEPVQLVTENDVNVTVSSGKSEFKLVGISGNDYPNIPGINEETSFTVKENVLKSMIAQTSYAIAQTDTKPVHMGSRFEIKDNVLNVVSTDGVRLAKRVEPVAYQDIAFVVPSKTLLELLRILDENNTERDITICIDRNQICISRDDYIIMSRLLEGDFIDYNKILGFTPVFTAKINVREFASALDRALLLITERFKSPVICKFVPGLLTVNCTTNLGVLHDEIPVDYVGDAFEIAFNARYMLEALRCSLCDEVTFQFVNPLKPIKIVPLGEETFTYLVLPVRLH